MTIKLLSISGQRNIKPENTPRPPTVLQPLPPKRNRQIKAGRNIISGMRCSKTRISQKQLRRSRRLWPKIPPIMTPDSTTNFRCYVCSNSNKINSGKIRSNKVKIRTKTKRNKIKTETIKRIILRKINPVKITEINGRNRIKTANRENPKLKIKINRLCVPVRN